MLNINYIEIWMHHHNWRFLLPTFQFSDAFYDKSFSYFIPTSHISFLSFTLYFADLTFHFPVPTSHISLQIWVGQCEKCTCHKGERRRIRILRWSHFPLSCPHFSHLTSNLGRPMWNVYLSQRRTTKDQAFGSGDLTMGDQKIIAYLRQL